MFFVLFFVCVYSMCVRTYVRTYNIFQSNKPNKAISIVAFILRTVCRIPDPSLEQHEISLVHRWFAVHRTLLFPVSEGTRALANKE